MGTCYTYLLYSEDDWYDPELTKQDIVDHIKIDFPVAEILGEWYQYIVIDLDKNSPYGDNIQRLKPYCDTCFFYGDGDSWNIREVKFKPIKLDKAKEANKPENRNKEYIKQANDMWMSKYNAMRN